MTSIKTSDSQNAALLGAAKAFGRPQLLARTSTNTHGALGVALGAARGSNADGSAPSRQVRLLPEAAGQPQPSLHENERRGVGRDLAKPRKEGQRNRSASAGAARLAFGKSPEPTANAVDKRFNKPAIAPKPRRLSLSTPQRGPGSRQDMPDDSSIAPTTSLVAMFERKSSLLTSRPEAELRPSLQTSATAPAITPVPAIRSPKPLRKGNGGITSMFQMELEDDGNSVRSQKAVPSRMPSKRTEDGTDDEYVSASEDTALASSPASMSGRSPRPSSASPTRPPTTARRTGGPLRALPSPARHSPTMPIQIQRPSPRPSPNPEASGPSSSLSTKSIAAQYHTLYPRRTTPLNTGSDLANALVASSLASSRAPSPRKLEVPPPPSRRRHQHGLSLSRSMSPVKRPARGGMRHTLRKEESEDSTDSDDDEHPYRKHQKKRLVRKHPNKHHEGDRKRWRDAVTERERKRYEGVWATNKGILCSLTADEERELGRESRRGDAEARKEALQDQICNLVAREIWLRSRLPEVVLENVWDLVDSEGVGRLSKEEFVVGMWLIDQRLKGRKLPTRVTDSVWQSVRSIEGIKIRRAH